MKLWTMALLGGLVLGAEAAAQDAVSTMGHARTRRLAELGRIPEPGDVVVQDIVNYHRHAVPLPEAGEQLALDLRFGHRELTPGGTAVLQVGLATPRVHDPSSLRPANLALVIDRSGSMGDDDKLACVRRALREFVGRLRPEDRLSLIGYSNEAELLMSSTRVGSGREIQAIIDRLQPDQSTNLHAGLMMGYAQIREHLLPRGTNRVILLTDGIANRGVTDPDAILADARERGGSDIDLSTIGVGVDLNRDLLQRLATGGRGLFHFVADAQDVQKVFVAEVQSLISPAARGVRLCIEWDRGLEFEKLYGYGARADGRRLVLSLPDLNYGATMVAMIKFRAGEGRRSGLGVRARVEYEGVEEGVFCERRDEDHLQLVHERVDCLRDHEVRKNYTVAVMADALHAAAEMGQRQRWSEAERRIQDALRFASTRYPQTEDVDLLQTRRMLEQTSRALAQRIECLRDLDS